MFTAPRVPCPQSEPRGRFHAGPSLSPGRFHAGPPLSPGRFHTGPPLSPGCFHTGPPLSPGCFHTRRSLLRDRPPLPAIVVLRTTPSPGPPPFTVRPPPPAIGASRAHPRRTALSPDRFSSGTAPSLSNLSSGPPPLTGTAPSPGSSSPLVRSPPSGLRRGPVPAAWPRARACRGRGCRAAWPPAGGRRCRHARAAS